MKLLFSLLTVVCCTTFLAAQNEPVTWHFDLERVDATTYDLTATADIDPGWYVYSQDTDEGGPIPTTFAFDNVPAPAYRAKEHGPERKEGVDDLFGINVIKFGQKMIVRQRLTVAAGIEAVRGTVTYMTCNGETCLPPTDVTFNVAVR